MRWLLRLLCRGRKPVPHAHGNVLCLLEHPCLCGECR